MVLLRYHYIVMHLFVGTTTRWWHNSITYHTSSSFNMWDIDNRGSYVAVCAFPSVWLSLQIVPDSSSTTLGTANFQKETSGLEQLTSVERAGDSSPLPVHTATTL